MQTAKKFEPLWNETLEMRETEKIISIRNERIKREQLKRARRSKFKMHICTLFVVLSFALVFGHVIYQNSIINEAKYEIFNLKTEIKTLTSKSEELQVKIEKQTDLKTVEKIAVEKLGMQYPSQDQTVTIDSKHHYTAKVPENVSIPIATSEVNNSGVGRYIGAFISGLFD